MHIRDMIEVLKAKGLSRADIAEIAGISYQQLTNSVNQNVQVEELKDGRFVTVRSNTTYFKGE